MKETTNKNPIKQRMILFLEHIGSNANQFAEKFIALGILGDNTKNYLHSKSGIQADMLTQISKNYPQLNMNWLLSGEGDMILSQPEDLSENKSNLSENSTDRNSIKNEYMTKSPVMARLVQYIKYIGKSVNAFETEWGVSKNYIRNTERYIKPEYLDKLMSDHPDIDLNWLIAGRGSMLLPESENLSEKKSNLAKQSKEEGRNSSVDEKIMDLAKKTVMEQIPAIIKAVGEAMRESRVDENNNIQKYLDNQKELSAMQMEIFRDIVKILAKSDPEAKEIDTKLRQISKRVV